MAHSLLSIIKGSRDSGWSLELETEAGRGGTLITGYLPYTAHAHYYDSRSLHNTIGQDSQQEVACVTQELIQ